MSLPFPKLLTPFAQTAWNIYAHRVICVDYFALFVVAAEWSSCWSRPSAKKYYAFLGVWFFNKAN